MEKPFLTPEQLAERWSLPLTTLSQWRWCGKGPEFFKMGKRVRYNLEVIERFEKDMIRQNTCRPQANLCPSLKV